MESSSASSKLMAPTPSKRLRTEESFSMVSTISR